MTVTVQFQELIAKFLASETTSRTWSIGLGSGTGTSAQSNTCLTNTGIFYTTKTGYLYNNKTAKLENYVPSGTTSISGTQLGEFGFAYQESGSGLTSRNTGFSPLTIDSNYQYVLVEYCDITAQTSSTNKIVPDTAITTIQSYLQGNAQTGPTHIAYGTYRILDKCDSGTGWSWTGDSGVLVVETSNYKEGVGSLGLTKTGTSTSTFGFYKTISGVDLSTVDTIHLYVRPADITTLNKLSSSSGLVLKYGSDALNVKQYGVSTSELGVGWTTLSIPTTSFVTSGSPTLTNVTYIEIAGNTVSSTDTTTGSNLLIDYYSASKVLSASDTNMISEVVRMSTTSTTRDKYKVLYETVVPTGSGNTYDYQYGALWSGSSSGTGNQLFYEENMSKVRKDSNTQINGRMSVGVSIYG